MSGMPDNTPRRRAEDNMITAAQIASHIASQLDGSYDDGIERHVRASAKGTIIGLDLTADEAGSAVGGECFIIAVISAPCPPPVDPADPS